VRRAFAFATDKATLADVIRRGYEFPATGGLLPPWMPGHSPGIGLPYDPERARRLLAQAGYAGGSGFPTVDTVILGPASTAEYLRDQWLENLGVEVAWEQVEWEETIEWMRSGREPPHLWLSGWGFEYPDPDNLLRVCVRSHPLGWPHETYAELVDGARRVLDQVKRLEMYQQADRILVQEAAMLPVSYGRTHLLVKPWVHRWSLACELPIWKDVVIEPH
jgi:ABC-type transport system substrate-binding protein